MTDIPTIDILGVKKTDKAKGACICCGSEKPGHVDSRLAATVNDKIEFFPVAYSCYRASIDDYLELRVQQELVAGKNLVMDTPEEFIADGGLHCPRCKSYEIEKEEETIEVDDPIKVQMHCPACGLNYYEVYPLANYEVLVKGE